MQSLCKDEVNVRQDSSLAVLKGRTLPVMWMKWPYPHIQRDYAKAYLFIYFFTLCTICTVKFMFYILFRIGSDFQPNCNDVLKDFTMW